MNIFKVECLLNSKLPNTHACSSVAQEYCPNPLLWVVISEKTCNKLIFQLFYQYLALSLQQSLIETKMTKFYDEIAF